MVEVPPGIKDVDAWLRRRAQRAARRPRLVNYPDLAPGESAVGVRRRHGAANVVISREAHAKPRSKYAKQ